ncbi:MAG TPA: TetR/AcrR family transcriptional regulator [Polyangiaceae bacterium]|jgi:AcrR family transcriptional regulator
MKKSDATREAILEAALRLFRKRGFEKTTMRDVAKSADVAAGAAYYYFPSKDAIVLAYYARTQDAHAELARAGMKRARTLDGRLRAVLHAKIDSMARDRKLLSALFRSIGDPASELSIFSAKTRRVRDESIALFDEALAPEELPPDLKRVLALSFWSLSMGLVLFFIHDTSPKQRKTRLLVDRAVDLLAPMMPMAAMMAPMGTSVLEVLREVGLTP